MKKRLLSLLLALVMSVGIIAVTTLTASALTYEMADAVIVNNVGLDDGYYVLEGSTEAKKGTPPADADYAYFKDRVLYLKNFDITTYRENRVSAEKVVKCGIGMFQYAELYWDESYMGSMINDFPLTIHLTGTNRITDSLADYSIYACYEATVTFTGVGTLEMNRPMEVSAGTTIKGGTIRMNDSGAADKVSMIKTENFKMEGGELNMRAAYRSGIECTGFTMSSGKLDVTVLGNSQYTGSGLLTIGSVSFGGGTAKIQSDGDAVQCSSLTIQDGIENVKFISTAASEQDRNYMAVDASFVTLPTQLTTYVSDNADGSDASVFTSGSLNGYDSVEIATLLSGKISGVTSTTETLVHIYETGNGVPLEIISVIGNGTYRFFVPKHGNYTILAIANGYEQQKAKITVSGNATQNFAMVEKRKFTTQPKGGTVGYNQRHTVNWATNFDAVKQELVRYSSAGNVVQIQSLDAGAFQAGLSYMTGGYYYRIRAYYDSTSYIESDKFYVTPDQYFTPNNQHGNEEGDIITGITYVPNGDGTFNANVHVDLNCVDGQMLQYYWASTGYYWYDHNNKLNYGIGTTDTSKLVFTLYSLGKNLVPGKEWKVKVYLADDPYADYEWRDVDFHYVTDTVPELKPEDVFTPAFTTQPAGGEVAKGEKLTVTWATNFTPKRLQVLKYSQGYCTGTQTLDVNATTANVSAGSEYYIIRAYYNDSNYVDSDKFYVTVKGNTVSGTITSFGITTDTITVELWKDGATSATYSTTTKGNTATYSFEGVEPDTYTLKIRKPYHFPVNATILVTEDTVVDVDMVLDEINSVTDSGATYNVRLIEPWALRVNVRFKDSNGNTIPVSEVSDYGAFAIRGSLLDDLSNVTVEQLLATPGTIHFPKGTEANGGMFPTGDGRATFHFFDGLYTYRLSEEVYWVAYYTDAEGQTYFTKVRNKSLSTLMNSMMSGVSDNEAEVYSWMLDMEESILEYRNGRTGEATVENAKTVGSCGISFGTHSGNKYAFGRSYRISLIEPWGIMLNTRIYDTTDANTSSDDHIDYAAADNYGMIIYHDKSGSLSGMDDYTDLLALDDAYVYSKDQGNLSIDGTKVSVAYNKDIYTYELNSKIYCVTFVIIDGECYYSAMTTRNLYELMGSRIESAASEDAEIRVYKAMRGMYESITKYRAGL